MPVAIRPATPADIAAITHIYGHAVRHGTASFELDPPDEAEMLRTFNCGIGMILIVAADDAERVADSLRAAGEAPIALGRIIEAASERVTFAGRFAL